jgi:hypothetical protein
MTSALDSSSTCFLLFGQTPKKHAKLESARHDTKVLKPVPPNFFYRRDENTPPTPRQAKTVSGRFEFGVFLGRLTWRSGGKKTIGGDFGDCHTTGKRQDVRKAQAYRMGNMTVQ